MPGGGGNWLRGTIGGRNGVERRGRSRARKERHGGVSPGAARRACARPASRRRTPAAASRVAPVQHVRRAGAARPPPAFRAALPPRGLHALPRAERRPLAWHRLHHRGARKRETRASAPPTRRCRTTASASMPRPSQTRRTSSMAKAPSLAGQSSPSQPPHMEAFGSRLLYTLWRSHGATPLALRG